MVAALRLTVATEAQVVEVREAARELAEDLGFDAIELTALLLAVSEVATNIVDHADRGEVEVRPISSRGRRGVEVVARDVGPGISDPRRALEDGYSTGRGLGLGLSSVRRLTEAFRLESVPGRGTTVSFRKWASRAA